MPVYTYHCENCEHEFEKYQSFSEDSLRVCPECEQEALLKVYSPALVVFKGSGFYVTDTKSSSAVLNSNNKETHSRVEKTSGDNSKEEKKSEPKAEKKVKTSAEKKK